MIVELRGKEDSQDEEETFAKGSTNYHGESLKISRDNSTAAVDKYSSLRAISPADDYAQKKFDNR